MRVVARIHGGIGPPSPARPPNLMKMAVVPALLFYVSAGTRFVLQAVDNRIMAAFCGADVRSGPGNAAR